MEYGRTMKNNGITYKYIINLINITDLININVERSLFNDSD